MRAESEALLILQDRDQRIRAMRNQQKSLPKDKKTLEDKLSAVRASLDAAKMLVKQNEVERRKIEVEVQTKRAAIGRFKTQQQATRKNDEFQAFNNEIAHFEADIRKLEDSELVFMEQAEALQAKASAAEKEVTKSQTSVQEQISKLEAAAAAATERLKDLEAERGKLASAISEDTLSLYDRLLVKKGDAAVVPLEHEICGGCHMKVPAHTAIAVRTEHGREQCPNCGRILYRVI